MKNITFSASEALIEKARLKAKKENTSLNKRFREWLEQYANRGEDHQKFNLLMKQLDYVRSGKTFSRDELNER